MKPNTFKLEFKGTWIKIFINDILHLKQKVARYDDLKQIWLPRSKIE
jgi:hypothetical protein